MLTLENVLLPLKKNLSTKSFLNFYSNANLASLDIGKYEANVFCFIASFSFFSYSVLSISSNLDSLSRVLSI